MTEPLKPDLLAAMLSRAHPGVQPGDLSRFIAFYFPSDDEGFGFMRGFDSWERAGRWVARRVRKHNTGFGVVLDCDSNPPVYGLLCSSIVAESRAALVWSRWVEKRGADPRTPHLRGTGGTSKWSL